jgi:hypothetical protein
MNPRYAGTSGSTQGERNDSSPAANAAANVTEPSMPIPGRAKRLRRTLFRLYYRIKYFPFAGERRKRLQLREDGTGTERGFIAIQIDALSHDDLITAIRQGYAPYLRRLLERRNWSLRKFPAGLPSATPAAQAAIFFGTKADIPAFRFYEKAERRVIVGSKPADVQFIRDRLPRDGVLRGGSSYVNIYDGGAERSAFTLSAHEPQAFLGKMGGRRVAMLALLHPFRMVRMILAAGWEYLREEWYRLASQIRGNYTYYWWYLPLLHIGSNILLRELQTIAVLLDIYTGAPSIYTTFNVYDEYAHHFGPRSRPAFQSIRAIDRRIGEIMRMLHRLPGRPYDIYILSDHGQTPSVPYRRRFGETLGDTVVDAARLGVFTLASTGDYTVDPQGVMDFLVRELEQVGTSAPTRNVALRIGRWIRREYNLFPLVAEVVREAGDAQMVVTYSSSLAHVYWTDPPRPLGHDDIRDDPKRRALYYFLVSHAGIGVVITRMVDGAHVESRTGRALLTPAGEIEVLAGANPLDGYAAGPVDYAEIARLAQCRNAGDLVLFGAYDAERDECICFDDQVGAHGAMGGSQSWPFIMAPRGLIADDYEIRDPLDLHPLFRRYVHDVERERAPGAAEAKR